MSASQTPDTSSPAADQPTPAAPDGPQAPSGLQRALVAIAALLTLLSPFLFFGSNEESVGNELVGDGLLLVTQHPVTRLAAAGSSSWVGWSTFRHSHSNPGRPHLEPLEAPA